MSPDWPRVSKNERHGYEEPEVPAAAPPPAPLSPYDWRVFKGIPDERSYSGTKIDELLTEYTAYLHGTVPPPVSQAAEEYLRAWSENFRKHARLAKIEWIGADALYHLANFAQAHTAHLQAELEQWKEVSGLSNPAELDKVLDERFDKMGIGMLGDVLDATKETIPELTKRAEAAEARCRVLEEHQKEIAEAAAKLLEWMPTCSTGSSGYMRAERLRELLALGQEEKS